jgi:hypothetical protein
VHSRAIEEYKRTLRLSQAQQETLVGLLLGDACLESQNGGRTYRLKIEQSARHEPYVRHIYDLFREWVLTPPRARLVISSNSAYSINWAFQTVSHMDLCTYGEAFYVNGRKRVPRRIDSWLTRRGFAYWFMDDGSMKSDESKGVVLNTQAYSLEEVECLVSILGSRFRLRATTRRQPDGYQIYISGRSHYDLLELIEPYVLEDMRYKVPQPRRTQLPKK